MEENINKVLDLISNFNKTTDEHYIDKIGDYSYMIFRFKYCLYYAEMLQKEFSNAKLYVNKNIGHVITKIGNHFFDVSGIVNDLELYKEVDEEDYNILCMTMKSLDKEENKRIVNLCDEIALNAQKLKQKTKSLKR